MKIKCNYCGNYINDFDENCANCGAVNEGFKRSANNQPTTIEELQQWYVAHNLPSENVTRFFIGKNVWSPRAFGIYKDEAGKCIVYKNKDTGERAVRYEGYDETYAVNEIYLKLKETINMQKANNAYRHSGGKRKNRGPGCGTGLITFMIIVLILIVAAMVSDAPSRGYYYYDNTSYYYLDGSYYYYDDYYEDWYYYGTQGPFGDSYSDYYVSDYDYDDYDTSNFTNTSYYDDWYENQSSDSSSDWDSGSSWDSSDSWDSGSSDWGSDW